MGTRETICTTAAKGRPQDRAGAIHPTEPPRRGGKAPERRQRPYAAATEPDRLKTKPDVSCRCSRRHRRRKRRGVQGTPRAGHMPGNVASATTTRLGLTPWPALPGPMGHPSRLEYEPGGEKGRDWKSQRERSGNLIDRAAATLAGLRPCYASAAARRAGQGPARRQRC